MHGDGHVRFGGRVEETDRRNPGHRASARPLLEVEGRHAPRTWFFLYVIRDLFSRFAARHKTAVLFPDPLCGRG